MNTEEIHILLVEDNEGDIWLTLEALHRQKSKIMSTLLGMGRKPWPSSIKKEYRRAVSPDLILLDINLPKIDGKEVLANIKNDDLLKHIRVVMLTTSSAEKDILDTYKNHANCYITKPVDLDKFIEVVHTIKNFWLTTVQLPA